MNQLPPGLAEAMEGEPERAPPSDKLRELRDLGHRLKEIQDDIAETEKHLKSRKEEANGIIHRTLPDAMGELQLDSLGLESINSDMIARNYYKANISAEWDEERRERAFRWLEENGFGSLIKLDVTYSFRRGEENKAHWLMDVARRATLKRAERLEEAARSEGRDVSPADTWDIPEPSVRKNVPHSTLTSLVKNQTELPAGDPAKKNLPLEILGAIVGRIVEIKPRKN